MVPPADVMASSADLEKACASTSILAFKEPLPRIFTRCLRATKPASARTSGVIFTISFVAANSCRVSRFTALYSTRLWDLNPNFGTRRCNGICPPSKPTFRAYPERDFCPLWPLVEVPPFPEPGPRPILLRVLVAPFAGFKFDKFIILLFLSFYFNLFNHRNQVIHFTDKPSNRRCVLMLNNAVHLGQS